MEQTWALYATLASTSLFFIIILQKIHSKPNKNQPPPSPPSLPIIGHLHLLKQPLHRTLQKLSTQYGGVYSLRFGCRPVVVVSCPDALDECFTRNDVVLCNRPRTSATKHLNYDSTTLEVLSTARVNSSADVRDTQVKSLVRGLVDHNGGCDGFVRVEMRTKFNELSFNTIMGIIAGKREFGEAEARSEASKEFCGIVREVFDLSGAPNPADFLPFLRRIIKVDFQNLEGKMVAVKEKMDALLQGLIEECRKEMKISNNLSDSNSSNALQKSNAMIYKLLTLQDSDPDSYSDQIIKGIILVMLTGGIDTTSITTEWALSLLLNNPDVLQKARSEIHNHVGAERLVNESDLPNLPYLQSIINETLRLFPASPLTVRENSEDCTIAAGYEIRQGTIVIINAWAIHRDANLWEDPLSFKPERFEGAKGDEYRSKWVPFGLGRRSCPGAVLANRVVALTLGALIQCFEWEKVDEEDLDLAESCGLTMPRKQPLDAMFSVRKNMMNVLLEL